MDKSIKIADNPFAFPSSRLVNGTASETHWGMTLRDHYAGIAMQAALTGLYHKEKFVSSDELLDSLSLIPKNAYWVADRMLEQRQK